MTKSKAPKRGRPELEESERRSVIVQFRVTPSEEEKIVKSAKGEKLSDWLRQRALGDP